MPTTKPADAKPVAEAKPEPAKAVAVKPEPEQKEEPLAVEPSYIALEDRPFVVVVTDCNLKRKLNSDTTKFLDYFDLPLTHYPDNFEYLVIRIDKKRHYAWLLKQRTLIDEAKYPVVCVFKNTQPWVLALSTLYAVPLKALNKHRRHRDLIQYLELRSRRIPKFRPWYKRMFDWLVEHPEVVSTVALKAVLSPQAKKLLVGAGLAGLATVI